MTNKWIAFLPLPHPGAVVTAALGAAFTACFVACGSAAAADGPSRLTVGVVQMIPVKEYAPNRDKMANYIRQAKAQGCRLVVFPERALHFSPDVPLAEVEAAIDHLRLVSDEADIYSVICSWRHDGVKPHNQFLVADPDGKVIHTYNKIWSDDRFTEAPGLFAVDGVLCCGTICADRWVRSVEELPAMAGAKILIECSNNYDNEWIDELGWYWYVPRAAQSGLCNLLQHVGRLVHASGGPAWTRSFGRRRPGWSAAGRRGRHG